MTKVSSRAPARELAVRNPVKRTTQIRGECHSTIGLETHLAAGPAQAEVGPVPPPSPRFGHMTNEMMHKPQGSG